MPPWVVQVSPSRKPSTLAPMTTLPLCARVLGYWSMIAVVIVSTYITVTIIIITVTIITIIIIMRSLTMVNWESRPRVMSMVKKRKDQMGGSGIWVTALG